MQADPMHPPCQATKLAALTLLALVIWTKAKRRRTKNDTDREPDNVCINQTVAGVNRESDSACINRQSFRSHDLRSFPAQRFLAMPTTLTTLDLSRNELAELPGIEALQALTDLDISRNWFRDLPSQLVQLKSLTKLNAGRNFLRPNEDSLRLPGLAALKKFKVLDLRFNKKCFRQSDLDMLSARLPSVTVHITVSFPAPAGAFVGSQPADRDATLLRSQLEPWSTTHLRQRLVDEFGQAQTDPFVVTRAEVMRRLLDCYRESGPRKLIRFDGKLIRNSLIPSLLTACREWERTHKRNRQERPSISATSYMILRSPSEFSLKKGKGSKKAAQAANKFKKYAHLWDLARQAIVDVDPEFAAKYTALAVTKGFRGSPHIDKQNVGPFYGLSLGDFEDGDGGVQVECSPRVVAQVNTKNRLGKVDGRFPHWVAPYAEDKERYSLIYYQTEGEPTAPQTTAVFY